MKKIINIYCCVLLKEMVNMNTFTEVYTNYLNKTATVNRIVKNYTKNFYSGNADPEDGGYYFHGIEVFARVNSWEFISEEEFNVLKKYL